MITVVARSHHVAFIQAIGIDLGLLSRLLYRLSHLCLLGTILILYILLLRLQIRLDSVIGAYLAARASLRRSIQRVLLISQ